MKLDILEAREGLYDYSEAVAALGVTEKEFADMVARGALKTVRKWGRVNYRPEEIERVKQLLTGGGYEALDPLSGVDIEGLRDDPSEVETAVDIPAVEDPAQQAAAQQGKQWSAPSQEWEQAKAGGRQFNQRQLQLIEILKGITRTQGIEDPEGFINAVYSADPRRAMAYSFLRDGEPGDTAVGRLPVPGSRGEFRKVNIKIVEAEIGSEAAGEEGVNVTSILRDLGFNFRDATELMQRFGVENERYDLGKFAGAGGVWAQQAPAAAAVQGAELETEPAATAPEPAAAPAPAPARMQQARQAARRGAPPAPEEVPAKLPTGLPSIAPPEPSEEPEEEPSGAVSGEVGPPEGEEEPTPERPPAAAGVPDEIYSNLDLEEPINTGDQRTKLRDLGFDPEQGQLYGKLVHSLASPVVGKRQKAAHVDPVALDKLAKMRTGMGLAQLAEYFNKLVVTGGYSGTKGEFPVILRGLVSQYKERQRQKRQRPLSADVQKVDAPIEFDWPEDAF